MLTVKKGAVFKNHTAGMQYALMQLKAAYRKRTVYIRQSHGHLTNIILDNAGIIIKEPMNYRALAKKSKTVASKTSRSSVVRNNKTGKTTKIYKFKRRKRFFKSILKRSPGLFNSLLEQKAKRYGISIVDVNIKEYRASQYDHCRNIYLKHELSQRTRIVGNHIVQRDLYSAFLLYCNKDVDTVDIDKCNFYFRYFLKAQGIVVNKMLKHKDTTKNFGLSDFIKRSGSHRKAVA